MRSCPVRGEKDELEILVKGSTPETGDRLPRVMNIALAGTRYMSSHAATFHPRHHISSASGKRPFLPMVRIFSPPFEA